MVTTYAVFIIIPGQSKTKSLIFFYGATGGQRLVELGTRVDHGVQAQVLEVQRRYFSGQAGRSFVSFGLCFWDFERTFGEALLGLHPVSILDIQGRFGLSAFASLSVDLTAIGVISKMQLLKQVLRVRDILMRSGDGDPVLFLHIRLLVLPLLLLFLPLQALELLLHVIFRRLRLELVGVAYEVEVFSVVLLVALIQPRLSLIIFVEVLSIYIGLQFRDERRCGVLDITPVDALKPTVILDLLSPIPAQSTLAIRQQPADEVDHLKRNRNFRGKVQELLVILNLVVYLLVVFGGKGSVAYQHFVDNHTQRPPVHQLCITYPFQHFRGDVVRCPHRAVCQLAVFVGLRAVLLQIPLEGFKVGVCDLTRHIIMDGLFDIFVLRCFCLFAQSKIAEFYVSSGIDENVIGFDIPMDVVLLVDALDGQHDLCCEEFGLFLLQDIPQDEEIHEISASEVIHDQIQVILILEGVEKLDYPFPSIRQDIPLCLEMPLLVLLDHLLLLQTLDGHDPACLLLPAQSDLPEGASADHANSLEILLADLLPSLPQILHLMLYDIFLRVFPLVNGEVQLLDFLLEDLPVLAPLLLLELVEVVLLLDIAFDLFGLLSGRLADRLICFHYYSVINGLGVIKNEVRCRWTCCASWACWIWVGFGARWREGRRRLRSYCCCGLRWR